MYNYIKLFFWVLILFYSLPIGNADNIYDNITTNNYKTLKISDDINIAYINEYKYEVYINNQFLGYYKKDDLIFIPDNSNITIYIPSPIKTDLSQSYNLSKSVLIIVIGFLLTFGLLLVFVFMIYKKIKER